ncbi:hypothetical protein VTI74DRAFT_9614 [Chaetomium olivicolor]
MLNVHNFHQSLAPQPSLYELQTPMGNGQGFVTPWLLHGYPSSGIGSQFHQPNPSTIPMTTGTSLAPMAGMGGGFAGGQGFPTMMTAGHIRAGPLLRPISTATLGTPGAVPPSSSLGAGVTPMDIRRGHPNPAEQFQQVARNPATGTSGPRVDKADAPSSSVDLADKAMPFVITQDLEDYPHCKVVRRPDGAVITVFNPANKTVNLRGFEKSEGLTRSQYRRLIVGLSSHKKHLDNHDPNPDMRGTWVSFDTALELADSDYGKAVLPPWARKAIELAMEGSGSLRENAET